MDVGLKYVRLGLNVCLKLIQYKYNKCPNQIYTSIVVVNMSQILSPANAVYT